MLSLMIQNSLTSIQQKIKWNVHFLLGIILYEFVSWKNKKVTSVKQYNNV